jgi:hypothetical protein
MEVNCLEMMINHDEITINCCAMKLKDNVMSSKYNKGWRCEVTLLNKEQNVQGSDTTGVRNDPKVDPNMPYS